MNMEQDELREILEEFFIEAGESLDQFEQDLIRVEDFADSEGGTDSETIDRIFRVLHTLKGGAGFLGLEKMAKLAHGGENLLDEIRGDRVEINKDVIDALLSTNDILKKLMNHYKVDQEVDSIDISELVITLEGLACGDGGVPVEVIETPEVSEEVVEEVTQSEQEESAEVEFVEETLTTTEEADEGLINQDLLKEVLGDGSLDPSLDTGADDLIGGMTVSKKVEEKAFVEETIMVEEENVEIIQEQETITSDDLVNQELLNEVMSDDSLEAKEEPEVPAKEESSKEAPVLKRGEAPKERRKTEDQRKKNERRQASSRRVVDGPSETIRVEIDRLDKVMNLVGELVLARNGMISQLTHPRVREIMENLENAALIQASIEQLSRVTKDLQMSVLSTRMQPIKKVFDKIPRQVRELKNQLNREVDLIVEGEMTEVDKSLVEELSDPMVHMIRNALDHGIETPEDRKAAGKHPTGSLVVRAFYEGNNVVVQVQEDGKGMDPDKLRKVAVEREMLTFEQAAEMSDSEAIRLVLAPGFSTAKEISDVSGRGVGMDVVNSKIVKLKGTLDIQSELGVGTTFSIYMPLTLAIVQALVVKSNEEGFAIPIGDISEVIKFRIPEIHRMNDRDVIELRGEALPLFYLSELTHVGFVQPVIQEEDEEPPIEINLEEIAAAEQKLADKPEEEISLEDLDRVVTKLQVTEDLSEEAVHNGGSSKGYVVVVRDGFCSLGLVVDYLVGQEEAVIKPVTDMFEYNNAISGATITGEGNVHMILDVPFMLKNLAGNKKSNAA